MTDVLRTAERAENFPVALCLLPGRLSADLVAVYGFARTVDDIGDEAAGDRMAQLDACAADLERIWAGGEPRSAVLRRLAPTVRSRELPREPFLDLIEANRWDQRISRYATYADLLAYCRLSANPVGRIVLGVFGVDAAPHDLELSDRICTGLQLVEHCQDVAEDYRAGRIYLPAEDLAAYHVSEDDLGQASAAVRRLMSFEAERAAALLDAGSALVGRLRGWARLAIAGYVAGGLAAVDALRRAGFDVSAGAPRPRHSRVLRHGARLVWTGGRR
jgi:squalene synthase HpnC